MQKRKGFTTVELVIVIAVIAILATALIPTFGGLIKSANLTTDKQTANALTTLTTMYAMEHGINSESDLADAINEGMGENYYQNLQAKSAQYGYCFWYDYDSYRVHLGTVEEISKLPRAYSPNGVRLGSAGSSSGTFAAGLRTDLVAGFFLMGQKDSNELLELVINLENASLETYQSAHKAVTNFNSDDPFLSGAVAQLAENLKTTLIHNDFARIVPSGEVEAIHIPLSVQVLNRTTTMQFNGESVTDEVTCPEIVAIVYLPNGVSAQLGALNYLAAGSAVNINASYGEMKDLIDLDAIKADVQVHTNDGSTYKQLDGAWVNAITGTVLDDCANSILLGSFAVNIPTGDGYVFPGKDGAAGTIYVSQDLKNFSLTANSFMDTNNAAFPESGLSLVQWSFDGNSMQSGSVLSCSMPHTNGSSVTVEANGVKYTYTVKTFAAETFGIYSLGGATSIDYFLDYTPGKNQDWTIVPQFGCTDGLLNGLINLDTTVSIVADSDSSFDDMFTITANGKLQFNGAQNPEISGDQSGKLTLKSRGLTTTVNLTLVDESNAVFYVADRADTQKNYGFTFTVGTVNAIPLEYLFDAPDTSNGTVVVTTNRGGEPIEITANTNYSEQVLDLSGIFADGGQEMTIKLTMKYKEGDPCARTLSLRVINGAHNVTNAAQWMAVPSNTSIAILNGFEIDFKEQEPEKDCEGNVVTPGLTTQDGTALDGTYVKNLGQASLYGNFQRIDVSYFMVFKGAINYFIRTEGTSNNISSIEQLILNGPDYGDVVSITGVQELLGSDLGDAVNKGTHVAAVQVTGTTIITDSFISGFRAPVSSEGSTSLTIKNTTLNRGNYANLDIAKASTIYLDNVTTIQYHGKSDNIGASIAFKYNSAKSTLIANNLTQHNYYTQSDIKNICNSIASVLPAVPISIPLENADFEKVGDLVHTINTNQTNSVYYNMGIIEIGLNISVLGKEAIGTPTVDITINGCTTADRINKNITGLGSASVKATGLTSCATCNHTLPSTDVEDHIDNFLAAR